MPELAGRQEKKSGGSRDHMPSKMLADREKEEHQIKRSLEHGTGLS